MQQRRTRRAELVGGGALVIEVRRHDDDVRRVLGARGDAVRGALARLLGPAIAGFPVAQGGATWVFWVNAVGFLGALVAVALLSGPRSAVGKAGQELGGAMKDRLRYVFGQRGLVTLIALTLVRGVFGTPPIACMLPGIVRFERDAGAATLAAPTGATRARLAGRLDRPGSPSPDGRAGASPRSPATS